MVYMLLYASMWGILMVNVTIYSICGSYGIFNGLPTSGSNQLGNRWGIHRNVTNVVSPNMRWLHSPISKSMFQGSRNVCLEKRANEGCTVSWLLRRLWGIYIYILYIYIFWGIKWGHSLADTMGHKRRYSSAESTNTGQGAVWPENLPDNIITVSSLVNIRVYR